MKKSTIMKRYYDEGNANGEIPKQIPLFYSIILDMEKLRNIAYIDVQNLNYSTVDSKPSWKVGLKQFRVYLKEKYRDYLDISLLEYNTKI